MTGLPRPRFHLRPGSLSILLPGGDVLTFDGEGRPFYAFAGKRGYRRGLSGKVLEVARGPDGRRRHRELPEPESRIRMDRSLQALDRWLRDTLGPGGDALPRRTIELLDAFASGRRIRSVDDLTADEERYRRTWGRVGITPPDDYLSVVLQATLGCARNRCRFCDFYRGEPYRVRGRREFADHLARVRSFLGRGLEMRRRVWLGEASLLGVPQDLLLADLDAIAATMPELAGRGVAAFGDLVASRPRTAAAYRDLAGAGLTALYIGLESGSEEVRSHLGKGFDDGTALQVFDHMRQAGIHVTPIILIGAGGRELAGAHESGTALFLERWGPPPGERVYLSPLRPSRTYRAWLAYEDLRPMTAAELVAQERRLRSALPHVRFDTYDIRGFLH